MAKHFCTISAAPGVQGRGPSYRHAALIAQSHGSTLDGGEPSSFVSGALGLHGKTAPSSSTQLWQKPNAVSLVAAPVHTVCGQWLLPFRSEQHCGRRAAALDEPKSSTDLVPL